MFIIITGIVHFSVIIHQNVKENGILVSLISTESQKIFTENSYGCFHLTLISAKTRYLGEKCLTRVEKKPFLQWPKIRFMKSLIFESLKFICISLQQLLPFVFLSFLSIGHFLHYRLVVFHSSVVLKKQLMTADICQYFKQ
jgi:hypothetical protein